MKKIAVAALVFSTMAAIPFTTAIGAETTTSADTTKTVGAQLTEPDTTFLPTAIRSGLAEVEIAKGAAQKASRPEVKQYAERLVKDHSQMNEKLMAFAQQHKISSEGTKGSAPLKADEEALQKWQKMSGMSGAQFDQSFATHMVEDHQKAIALFKQEAQSGKDDTLKKLAADALPTLEEHLKMAQNLASGSKATQ